MSFEETVYGLTDGHKSSPRHYVTGELKTEKYAYTLKVHILAIRNTSLVMSTFSLSYGLKVVLLHVITCTEMILFRK